MVGSKKVRVYMVQTKFSITIVATKVEGDKYGDKLIKGDRAEESGGPREKRLSWLSVVLKLKGDRVNVMEPQLLASFFSNCDVARKASLWL